MALDESERLLTECLKAREALLGHAGGSVALACLNRALQTPERAPDYYDPRTDLELPEGLRDPQETLRRGREVLDQIEMVRAKDVP
jgi:hypothetical protein